MSEPKHFLAEIKVQHFRSFGAETTLRFRRGFVRPALARTSTMAAHLARTPGALGPPSDVRLRASHRMSSSARMAPARATCWTPHSSHWAKTPPRCARARGQSSPVAHAAGRAPYGTAHRRHFERVLDAHADGDGEGRVEPRAAPRRRGEQRAGGARGAAAARPRGGEP
eukprot:5108225-Prymnesium_polylepis.1